MFFPLFAVVAMIMFTTFDAFIVRYGNKLPQGEGGRNFICIAPIALMNIYLICGAFLALNSHDSEIFYLTWIVRDVEQLAILYFIVFKLTGALSSLFSGSSSRRSRAVAQVSLPTGRLPM